MALGARMGEPGVTVSIGNQVESFYSIVLLSDQAITAVFFLTNELEGVAPFNQIIFTFPIVL